MNGDNGQQHEDDPQGERDNIVIQSLLATIEKQANIISEQYVAINTMGERLYEVVNQNNQIMKVVYEATIALPDHIKNTGDDFDKNAFSRFGVLRDSLLKVQKDLKNMQEHINIQMGSYGYTEEKPSTFSPGGSRGVG